jgi:L-ascorbate metabolism protein UlaG (beta-lactamase superfamily)
LCGGGLAVSSSLAVPPHRGPPSDHFDGSRFINLEPYPEKRTRDLLRWWLTARKGPWRDWVDEPSGPKPAERVGDGRIVVTWINHATLLVQMDGVNVLTDPVYSESVGPFSFVGPRRHRAPGIRFEDLPPLDAVAVSHNHYDHMDLPTLRRLSAERAAPVVVGLGNASYLAQRGVASARDVDWWDSVSIRDSVRIVAVPSRHWSARSGSDRRHTLWAAFVIEGPSGRVYFGGDTGYGRHFALARERLGAMDVALLPIGAYKPEWFMRENHLSPAEAVRASGDLAARVSLPMHFDTWQLGDDGETEPLDDLQAALRGNAAQQRVFVIARHGVPIVASRSTRSPASAASADRP